jgi:uncharacterized protein YbjT (DUF2867 family)
MNVFITGGTGYLGQRLVPRLMERRHGVTALVRKGSESKLPARCQTVYGDALKPETFTDRVKPADTFVQLVGVAHPGPAKAKEFREIDLASVRASVAVAVKNGISHFVYVSVAQPAPVMKAYQEVRAEGEALLRASAMNTTVLRPWYILGPGHWWPLLTLPGYWACQLIPATRAGARRLGLVTLAQMVAALVAAVEQPPHGVRVMEVPDIRHSLQR